MDSYEPPRSNAVGIGTVVIVAGLVSGLVSVMVVAFGFMVYIAATGGAGLDDKHRLIGITTAMHGDLAEFSATGLALPISEIPEDWLPLLR